MPRMSVVFTADYMRQMRLTPQQGLLELLHNAFDADATRVEVAFELAEGPLNPIETISVTDNGVGMRVADVEQNFRPMGTSWKRRNSVNTTPSGRDLFGRHGRGRFGAFGLGELVTWTSVTDDEDPERRWITQVVWRGDEEAFDGDEELVGNELPSRPDLPQQAREQGDAERRPGLAEAGPETRSWRGTRVEVTHVAQACERLRTVHTRNIVADHFFSYLHQYPGVELIYDGVPISPDDRLIERSPLLLDPEAIVKHLPDLPAELADAPMTLEISEWEHNVTAALHLADEAGWTVNTIPTRVNTPGISYSAKLRWAGSRELAGADLEDMDHATRALLKVVRRTLRQHFEVRADDARRALLDEWRAEGSYPYTGDPATSVDEAERDLFDIVAVTAAPALNSADAAGRRFAFRLLKAAVQTDASALRNVLEQVVGLGEEDLADLDELLGRVPLTSMIAMQRTATDRIAFRAWLEASLTVDAWVEATTERGGLQEYIESNVWIFGDDWQTVIADKALATGLRRLRELDLGDSDVSTVLDADGRRVRVDLLLSRARKSSGRRQNLVVELKRPSQKLGKKELDQLDNYVQTVIADPQFNDGRIDWTFVLVGLTADEFVDRKRTADDRPVGRVDKQRTASGATYETKVLTWAEIIEDAKTRLAFLAEHIPDFPTHQDMSDLSALHATIATVGTSTGA